jgi:hypothetical protein
MCAFAKQTDFLGLAEIALSELSFETFRSKIIVSDFIYVFCQIMEL